MRDQALASVKTSGEIAVSSGVGTGLQMMKDEVGGDSLESVRMWPQSTACRPVC
jgi:hypothetical protein